MITSEELCVALESLLAIRGAKGYSTWSETNVSLQSKALAKRYREETSSIPPEEVLLLKPHDTKTFEEGKVDFSFETEPPTLVDVSLLQSSYASGQSSEATLPLELTLDEQNQSLRSLAAYEAFPDYLLEPRH